MKLKQKITIWMIALITLMIIPFTLSVDYPACCCSEAEVYVVWDNSDYIRCSRASGDLVEGTAASYSECLDSCNIPACTNCKEGSCSDYDNCDFNLESGLCSSGYACCTGTCTLSSGSGQGCEDSNLNIKPTEIKRGSDLGQKQITLSWTDSQNCPSTNYEIFRCEGTDCTPEVSIGITTQQFYVDTNVNWKTNYRYFVKGYYQYQGQKESDTLTIYSGDEECESHTQNEKFCVGNSYYYCSVTNILNGEVPCSSSQVCASGTCVTPSECSEEGNPFGFYHTISSCEGPIEDPKYCFFDRSKTNIDNCYLCGGDTMNCYDYKTKRACQKDNCGVGSTQNPSSCKWAWTYEGFGIGVCIDKEKNNCELCKEKGSNNMATVNFESFNDVFDIYSAKKISALSTEKYPCFVFGDSCMSCEDNGCPIYKTQSDCSSLGSTPISLNNLNDFITSSGDSCKINTCRWINNQCQKDADGVGIADCSDSATPDLCEQDYLRPNTTIGLIEDTDGVVSGLSIAIFDKTRASDTNLLRTSSDYKTYYCLSTETNSCNPRTFDFKETTSRTLAIGEIGAGESAQLKLCDTTCTTSSFTLSTGLNKLLYYSEDPSLNIGLVKEIQFSASPDFRPIPNYYVENATYINGIFYTNHKKPTIKLNFSTPSKIDYYRLEDSSQQPFELPILNEFAATTHSIIPLQNLSDGTYIFTFNAENEYGREMVNNEQFTFIIDTVPPTITISPNNQLLTNSTINLTITFDKKVFLNKVFLNDIEITQNLSTIDNQVFEARGIFPDGVHIINVSDAESYSGNKASGLATFEINAEPTLQISLSKPTYGVSPIHRFELEVKTDNTAECKYSLDTTNTFERLSQFSSTNSASHTKELTLVDTTFHLLYVQCRDNHYETLTSELFDLMVDTTAPTFMEFTGADPNLVATSPPFTTLKATTDDETICNYTSTLDSGTFFGFDTKIFENYHTEEIYPPSHNALYTYTINCMNKAELVSSIPLTFNVSNNANLDIISLTKSSFNTTTIDLRISTNLDTDCKYSTDKEDHISAWFLLTRETTLTRNAQVIVPGDGQHKYYVRCYDAREPGWIPSAGFEITFTVDTTPPEMEYVNDSSKEKNPGVTWRTDRLRVSWLGEDEESGISQYHYRLREYGSSKDLVFNWTTETEEDEWIYIDEDPYGDDLNLTDGIKYQFEVKPENTLGIIGNAMTSNGITIDVDSKPEHCTNEKKDEGETDEDCGGECDGCEYKESCKRESDCESDLYCNSSKKCDYPGCNDNTKNGDETDEDCGGEDCSKCNKGDDCSEDSDCKSDYCSSATKRCSAPDKCSNGFLDPQETGVDCGGICSGCSEGNYCDIDDDCLSGLSCIEGRCKSDSDGDGILDKNDNCPSEPNIDQLDSNQDGEGDACDEDIDGDGLTNEFENKYNLDPYTRDSDGNTIDDGEEDKDNDQLTNKQEQDYSYSYCLNPWNKDTDQDGSDDNKEINKGTDACDENSKPKSVLFLIIVLILLLIALGLVFYFGYPKYKEQMEKKKQKTKQPLDKLKLSTHKPLKSTIKHPPQKGKLELDPHTKKLIEKKKQEKEKQRKGLFSSFGAELKSSIKPIKETTSPSKTKQTPKTKLKPPKGWIDLAKLKQGEKEDVFVRLKKISKTPKRHDKNVFKKLEKVSKTKNKKTTKNKKSTTIKPKSKSKK
jgi:hypothetical protein